MFKKILRQQEANDIKEKYYKIRSECLTFSSMKFRRVIQWIFCCSLLLNYLFCFTQAYTDFFPILYSLFSKFTFIIIPNFVQIQTDMMMHKDIILFEKYYVFSFINIVILLLSSLLFLIATKVKVINQITINLNLNLYFLYIFAALIGLYVVAIIFNSAGYDNPRPLVYPALGRGVFFFCRDSFFYYGITWGIGELVVIGSIIYHKGLKNDG